MMKLGESSSVFKGLSINQGSVFKMTLYPKDGVTPQKEGDISRTKYFVVIGKDSDSILVGALLINTEVNVNLITVIAPYQYCIYPSDYDFLGSKCRYVDCYRIKELSYERIVSEGEYIGIISDADMAHVIDLVRRSPVNKPLILRKYGIFNVAK